MVFGEGIRPLQSRWAEKGHMTARPLVVTLLPCAALYVAPQEREQV